MSRVDLLNPHHTTPDESVRYTPSTSPYAAQLYHSPSPRNVHSPGDKCMKNKKLLFCIE